MVHVLSSDRALRVLLAESDPAVAKAISQALVRAGHTVAPATTAAQARIACSGTAFEVAVIGARLSDGSGLELCTGLRAMGDERPLLVVSQRSSVRDRLAALKSGADDCLTAPFAMIELDARVRALGRRERSRADSKRDCGSFAIDRPRGALVRHGLTIMFTARELEILALLVGCQGRMVPREEILRTLWGHADTKSKGSLDVLMNRIRRKLAEHLQVDPIRTMRRVGYAWLAPN